MSTPFIFGCAICTEGFDIHKIVCAPRCGHVYHAECLRRWLSSQHQQMIRPSCPKCRTTIGNRDIRRLFLHQVDAPEPEILLPDTENDDFGPLDDSAASEDAIDDADEQLSPEIIPAVPSNENRLGSLPRNRFEQILQSAMNNAQEETSRIARRMSYLSALDRQLHATLGQVYEMQNIADELSFGMEVSINRRDVDFDDFNIDEFNFD